MIETTTECRGEAEQVIGFVGPQGVVIKGLWQIYKGIQSLRNTLGASGRIKLSEALVTSLFCVNFQLGQRYIWGEVRSLFRYR